MNTVSRMESHGTPGETQMTRATHELLKDEFVCRPRGTIVVKGKGEMETWYLEGSRSAGPPVRMAGIEAEPAGNHRRDRS